YSGRGTLKSWVRVAAARLVVDLARKRREAEPRSEDELARLLPATADPELEYLRHAYADTVPRAFRQALEKLSVRQRNLLRQRYLHDLGGVELAAMYGVHRATVFGWLDGARVALLDHVRDAIRNQVPGHELDSIVALLGSHLEVSVRRLLDSRLEDEKS